MAVRLSHYCITVALPYGNPILQRSSVSSRICPGCFPGRLIVKICVSRGRILGFCPFQLLLPRFLHWNHFDSRGSQPGRFCCWWRGERRRRRESPIVTDTQSVASETIVADSATKCRTFPAEAAEHRTKRQSIRVGQPIAPTVASPRQTLGGALFAFILWWAACGQRNEEKNTRKPGSG